MLKIIDRHILSELLKSLLLILFSFIFLFLIFDFSINAGKFFTQEIGFNEIIDYYMMKIPSLITEAMPMMLLLALFWSMNQLNKNHEIAALQASGISVVRICMPLFILGFLMALLNFEIHEKINTKYAKKINRFMEKVSGRKTGDVLEKQHFFTDINSSLLWFSKFNPKTSKMESITWDCFGHDDTLILRIFADSGEYISDSWWLYDIKIISFSGDKEVTIPYKYKRRWMCEWDFRPAELSRNKDFTELRLSRLKKRMYKYRETQPEMSRNMRIEIHNRYALPSMNIVALLLSLPFAFRIKATRSVLAGIGISFLLVFAYYGIYTLSVIIGKNGFFVPYIIWTPSFLFAGLGILFFRIMR